MGDGSHGGSATALRGAEASGEAERLRRILQGAVDHAIIAMDLDRTAAVLGHAVASEPGRGSLFSVALPLAGRPGDPM